MKQNTDNMKDDGTPYPFAMGPTDDGYKLKINNMENVSEVFLNNIKNDFVFYSPNVIIDFGNSKLIFNKDKVELRELLYVYEKLKNYLNSINGVNL